MAYPTYISPYRVSVKPGTGPEHRGTPSGLPGIPRRTPLTNRTPGTPLITKVRPKDYKTEKTLKYHQ